MSASSAQDSASMGQKSRRAVRPDTASDVRPSVRSNEMRRFVMGYIYTVSLPQAIAYMAKGTNNVGIIFGQHRVVVLQDLLEIGLVGSLGLPDEPHESRYALIVLTESLDEPFDAFIGSLLVTCPQA